MGIYAIVWISIAIILGIIESVTVNLVTVWFALGALGGFVTAFFTDSVLIQSIVFLVISILMLIFTRPLAKKLLSDRIVPTNSDRIIGEEALVTEKIDLISGSGQVKIMGQIWSAKSADKSVIDENEMVMVEKIEGVCAVVSRKQ